MSDGLVIPIDGDDTRIRGKLARVKKEAAGAGRAFGQAQSQAARIGGPAGGALGRAVGGFNQGTGAGVLGLGLTAVGLGLNAFLQRDAERVNAARSREQAIQGRDAQARTVLDRREASAAGGMQFIGAARRLIARGKDSNYISSTIRGGAGFGLNAKESIMSADVAETTGVSVWDIQKGMATGLLGDSSAEVANSIQKFGGLTNAIAATRGVSTSQAADMVDRVFSDPRSKNVARAGGAMTPVEQRQLDDLLGGKTGDAMVAKANDELNPAARLAQEASQKVMDTVNQLTAAANAQSSVAALLSEMGRVIGLSEGSASRAVTTFADAQGVQ